jgi:inner membrane transporter RhtA
MRVLLVEDDDRVVAALVPALQRVHLHVRRAATAAEAVPPHAWFAISAVSRYLGPSFAVLLFPAVGVLGIAWLRIASAALVFGLWARPWRTFRRAGTTDRWLLIGLGACLATMNSSFYLALDRLPLSLVAAIEFAGVLGVALYGLRTRRNMTALVITGLGIIILIDFRGANDPGGLFWAFLTATLFVGYIVLGQHVEQPVPVRDEPVPLVHVVDHVVAGVEPDQIAYKARQEG